MNCEVILLPQIIHLCLCFVCLYLRKHLPMMLSIVQHLVWLFEFITVILGVAMFYFHLPFYLKNIVINVIFRNMLLEQLSRLPHVPSVPFQTTPPITQVPEEVGGMYLNFSFIFSQYHLFTISLYFDLTGGLLDVGGREHGSKAKTSHMEW
jgi:hypothetical protein